MPVAEDENLRDTFFDLEKAFPALPLRRLETEIWALPLWRRQPAGSFHTCSSTVEPNSLPEA